MGSGPWSAYLPSRVPPICVLHLVSFLKLMHKCAVQRRERLRGKGAQQAAGVTARSPWWERRRGQSKGSSWETEEGVGCGKTGAGHFFPHGVNRLQLATRLPRVPSLCGADERSQVTGRGLVLRYLYTTAPPAPTSQKLVASRLGVAA